MQEALEQNQQYAADIALLQEDMQTLLIKMDAAKQEQTDSEVALAQERQLTSLLNQDKANLELTMQQFHKAYDELEAVKNGFMNDKTRLEQQFEDALKSAELAAKATAAEHEKVHKSLVSQHEAAQASTVMQSEQSLASKDQNVMELQER